MSVSLQKGQKVDLTKGNSGLKKVMVGLGWDEAVKKGFLGGLLGGGSSQDIDCDASAILCTAGGKLTGGLANGKGDVVFFNNLKHESGCINHMGDNLTGAGDGDDEQIWVNLKDMPQKYEKIVFIVNIYQARERHQHFGMIKNAFIRIVDADKNVELCRYNLSESYDNMTSMIFGEIYRYENEWKFNAVGQATTDNGIGEIARRYL